MTVLRRFFRPSPQVMQYAREEGIRAAQYQLVSELRYIISDRKLLRQADNRLSEKWVGAFELLFPSREPLRFQVEEFVKKLVALGFAEPDARDLVMRRQNNPEILVAQLLALACGATEETVWGLSRKD